MPGRGRPAPSSFDGASQLANLDAPSIVGKKPEYAFEGCRKRQETSNVCNRDRQFDLTADIFSLAPGTGTVGCKNGGSKAEQIDLEAGRLAVEGLSKVINAR